MIRIGFIILMASLVGACDGAASKFPQPALQKLTVEQSADARNAAGAVIGSNGRALFICGAASGVGVFTRDWKAGFTADGMDGGRLVFLIRNDGRADVFFRDAVGQTLSSIDDGAEVRRISNPAQQVESWVVFYPSTGVVETHNIIAAPEDGLVNMWTSNKPTSVIGASAKLFRSSCVRA